MSTMTLLMLLATFLPLAGAIALLVIPKENRKAFEWGATLIMLLSFALSVPFWFDALSMAGQMDKVQWAYSVPWIPALGARFSVGMDGFSLILWLLTTFIGPLAAANSWGNIEERFKEYYYAKLGRDPKEDPVDAEAAAHVACVVMDIETMTGRRKG